MYSFQIKKQAGFTLIEFLLYLSLTVGMLLILSGIGASVLHSRVQAKNLEEVQYNAEFAFKKMRSVISGAESIVVPQQGLASTTLTLNMRDASKNPTTIDVFEGTLRLREGTSSAEILITNETVLISDVLFTHIEHESNSPGAVSIEMTIAPSRDIGYQIVDAVFDFQTTVQLKK